MNNLLLDTKRQFFKRQSHKMVKYTQIIWRQKRVFDNFVGLALKGFQGYTVHSINQYF